MLGWEVQSFNYTLLHWNFLLFRNNLKTCKCTIIVVRYLHPIIINVCCFSQDIRLTCLWDCTHHTTTAGTRWAYRTLGHMHNIHSFSTRRESSQNSWAMRTKSKIYRSATYFIFYNIMYVCDKQQFPRNSQFSSSYKFVLWTMLFAAVTSALTSPTSPLSDSIKMLVTLMAQDALPEIENPFIKCT